jgi:hypothetical protein
VDGLVLPAEVRTTPPGRGDLRLEVPEFRLALEWEGWMAGFPSLCDFFLLKRPMAAAAFGGAAFFGGSVSRYSFVDFPAG